MLAESKLNETELGALSGQVTDHRHQIVNNLKAVSNFLENGFLREFEDMRKCEQAERSAHTASCSYLPKEISTTLELGEILAKYGSDIQTAIFYDKLNCDLLKKMEDLTKSVDKCTLKVWKDFRMQVNVINTAASTVQKEYEKLREILADCNKERAAKRKNDPTNGPVEKKEKHGESSRSADIAERYENENAAVTEERPSTSKSPEPTVENGRRNSEASNSSMEGVPCLLEYDIVKTGEHNIVLPIPDARYQGNSCFNDSVLLNDGSVVFINSHIS